MGLFLLGHPANLWRRTMTTSMHHYRGYIALVGKYAIIVEIYMMIV